MQLTELKYYIGIDFSIDKPAMTFKMPDGEYAFFIFPLNIPASLEKLYIDADVDCSNRKLNSISKKELDSSQIVNCHIERAYHLAQLVKDKILEVILNYSKPGEKSLIYLATEGLAFSAKGDAALDLATYKGILLSTLYKTFIINNQFSNIQLVNNYTYSPITIKSIAGCATKDKRKDKTAMIKAFMEESTNTKFENMLKTTDLFNAKTNYKKCVDDIVDSYWALKTMIIKEKL